MRFVVTGATSMIGSAFVKAALQDGHQVLALIRKETIHLQRLPQNPNLKLQVYDFSNRKEHIRKEEDYDIFYHFAWGYTNRLIREDVIGQEKNIAYTLQAVKLAKELGCHTFVGAGSQAEYGSVKGKIYEDTPLNPITPYAVTKVAAARLSKILCQQLGIKHIWARIFSVYGTCDHEGTLIDYAVNCFAKGVKAEFTTGEQSWNFLHEKDAGEMMLRIATREIPEGVVFIANTESRPLRDYILEMIDVWDGQVEYSFSKEKNQPGVYGIDPDMKRTEELLQYKPQISFKEGMREIMMSKRYKECTE